MKLTVIFAVFSLAIFVTPSVAIVDPLAVANNRVGVHVLDPDEVHEAAKLVNSNGGEWGYVTVVLRSNELDRGKWMRFFENCSKLKVIPIVRLATYPVGDIWVKPDVYDLVDYANFLADMPWPIKNRYIVLFNEVNHAAEWGGLVNPLEYATLILDANRIFKTRSSDFYLLSAGLDMSAPHDNRHWNALQFYREISRLQPDWYTAIDGLAVHAYPNPAFSSPPASTSRYGISSWKYEVNLLSSLGYSPKPIFITETGWPHDSQFFSTAFDQIWTDERIVAVTPFVLFAGSGDFARFSLLTPALTPKITYREMYELKKQAGAPLLSKIITTSSAGYSGSAAISSAVYVWDRVKSIWANIWGKSLIKVGEVDFWVEIARSDEAWQRGLSGRVNLSDKTGMLFVFDHPDRHGFWMKDMNFALDFIWIRGGKVVEINENILPPSQTGGMPATLTPSVKIDQVLEVSAGSVAKYGIKVGDVVRR